jgi:hypothetical protein
MTVDESDRAIARSVLALGRDLGLVTVAEGVESREGWDLLTSLGCDLAQGFVVCPPLTSRQFGEWLDRRQPEEFSYLEGFVEVGADEGSAPAPADAPVDGPGPVQPPRAGDGDAPPAGEPASTVAGETEAATGDRPPLVVRTRRGTAGGSNGNRTDASIPGHGKGNGSGGGDDSTSDGVTAASGNGSGGGGENNGNGVGGETTGDGVTVAAGNGNGEHNGDGDGNGDGGQSTGDGVTAATRNGSGESDGDGNGDGVTAATGGEPSEAPVADDGTSVTPEPESGSGATEMA